MSRTVVALSFGVTCCALVGCFELKLPKSPAQGGPAWEEITTDHFTIETNWDDAEATKLARDFEVGHRVMTKLAFGGQARHGTRIRVFALSHEEFAEFSDRGGLGVAGQPGAGGLCTHTVIQDPKDHKRLFVAISAAGAFRSDDGGATWKAINRGLRSQFVPDPDAEIGHCVHHVAMSPQRTNLLYMQKHWDVLRSDDAGDNWTEVSGNLPTDFGFPIEVHAHEPETIYVVPITSDEHHFPPDGKLRVFRSRTGGEEWEALTKGLPQADCYVNVLRDAMAVDTLDDCGIYFGTTGGQVYASADSGDSWAPIVRDLPAVLSVEVQTLP